MPADPAVLDQLRRRLAALDRGGIAARPAVGFGIDAIDSWLPGGGLATGALHALAGARAGEPGDAPCGPVTALAAILAGRRQRTTGGPVVWLARSGGRHESLHAPGLAAWGLEPWREHLLVVRVADAAGLLWAAEEALRESSVAAVCLEADDIDLTASRRLTLAAEAGGTLGLVLPRAAAMRLGPLAATTLWEIASLPSAPACPARLPGAPRWRLALRHARGGRPGSWDVEWAEDARSMKGLLRLTPDTPAVPPLRTYSVHVGNHTDRRYVAVA
ncbi:MAG: ImuA family protein [Alphaproteobacteria bacterium]